jgi:putative NADPH-quinone reductase
LTTSYLWDNLKKLMTINKILAILASPTDEQDKRLNEITKAFNILCQNCAQKGVKLDTIDLYDEDEFAAADYLDSDNSKVLEYQIRIKNADLIVVFHPVIFDSVPAVLKGFLDNVMTVGFAYNIENKISVGALNDKELLVVAFDENSLFQSKYVFGNQLQNFWKKTISHNCGFKKTSLEIFYSYRSDSESKVVKWDKKIQRIANKINFKTTILDI